LRKYQVEQQRFTADICVSGVWSSRLQRSARHDKNECSAAAAAAGVKFALQENFYAQEEEEAWLPHG
jgi:hypothetical protein